ncbi:MAG: hypothetical protein K9W46_10170 [Candidatus Heimdallarchaeum endolithica]|uniref:Uncharacterized protein n=1 Tax=Candidatus Heimdallarchaeum endolithica TaxID=2876572 RepID=A0A9Y1BPT5_9ARCH|nr:MAG: hypothetical protein K9W46_10170 [Candidatus Heimdallarchaeum endolithica]
MKNIIKNFKLILKNKKGSPILEEILLIGIAIFIFIIVFTVVSSMIDWAEENIKDFFFS